jgi:hypothetical protein
VTTPSPGDLLVLHAEVGTAVLDEHVPFFEGAFVEQQFQPLARRQLALGMLRLDALLAAAQPGLLRACSRVVQGCRAWSVLSVEFRVWWLEVNRFQAAAARAQAVCAPRWRRELAVADLLLERGQLFADGFVGGRPA